MNTEKRVAINMVSKYAAWFVGLAVSVALTPFLIDSLGRPLLGLQVLAAQALNFCVLLNSAINQGYSRFATTHYARGEFRQMNTVLGSGLLLTILLAIPALIALGLVTVFADALFGLTPDIVSQGRGVILITGIALVTGQFIGVWEAPVFITQRFYLRSIASVVGRVVPAVGVVVLFYLFAPSILVWAALGAGGVLAARLLIVVPTARRALPQMKIKARLAALRGSWGMVRFSGLSFLGSLGYLLYYATDAIIISNLDELGPSMIIVYNLGQRWDPFIRQAILAFAHSLTPALTGMAAKNDSEALKRALYRGTRYCLLLGLFPCAALFAFSTPLIRCWVGESFVSESAPVLRLITLNLALSIPSIMSFQTLFALGRLTEAVIATVVGGVANVVLSVVLVKYAGMGLTGVALSTLITLGLKTSIYGPILVSQKLKTRVGPYLRHSYIRPILAAVPLIAACAAIRITWATTNWWVLLGQVAICGAVYAPSTWFIGFVEQDRDKVKHAATKVLAYARSLGARNGRQ